MATFDNDLFKVINLDINDNEKMVIIKSVIFIYL